MSLLVRQHIGT